ncbi:MAG TPA: alpha/beta fold hydrolase [Acidobacteriaceae bacterium]|nr:alpha/beta fold hydrolase [Acidobacteriaceae bacterium]
MARRFLVFVTLLGTFSLMAIAQSAAVAPDAAITTDPAPDKKNPALIDTFQLPSHGALLNALIYVASGAGPHPTVVLLHGFPGNERNLDVAQTIRRAGWNVLFFDYRGSWGSPGNFSFAHCIEDTAAAVAWLRVPANAAKERVNAKRIVLVGHSMGGFMAVEAGARDPQIEAVITISGADMGMTQVLAAPAAQRAAFVPQMAPQLAAEGMAPLAGTSPEALAKELVANVDEWNFVGQAARLATRPLLAITSDDGWRGPAEALVAEMEKDGTQHASTVHMTTDHSYSDHRIALEEAVLGALAQLGQ